MSIQIRLITIMLHISTSLYNYEFYEILLIRAPYPNVYTSETHQYRDSCHRYLLVKMHDTCIMNH